MTSINEEEISSDKYVKSMKINNVMVNINDYYNNQWHEMKRRRNHILCINSMINIRRRE